MAEVDEIDLEKTVQIDQLTADLEFYKNEYLNIHMTYDLESLEKQMQTAKKKEEWAENIMQDIYKLFRVIEGFLVCQMCNS